MQSVETDFLAEEEILPVVCNTSSCLRVSSFLVLTLCPTDLGLASIHNCISQFHKISQSFSVCECVCVYPVGPVSLENPNIPSLRKIICPSFYLLFLSRPHMPNVESKVGLELTTLRSRPELRSRVGYWGAWVA